MRRPVAAGTLQALGPNFDTGPSLSGYAEFEIDIEAILRAALPAFFERISAAPLNASCLEALPTGAKGAYLLLNGSDIVYAGKTDTRHGFRDRLGRHLESVQHRVGLNPDRIHFKAVRIMVFSAFDIEAILIGEMRAASAEALPWNDSGFGSNDPGRRRDGQEPAKFDRWFPIDIDRPLTMIDGRQSVSKILKFAKNSVPYLLRYQDHSELDNTVIDLTSITVVTMRILLRAAIAALPDGWQCTVLHNRIILYREIRKYDFATEIMRQ